MDAENSKNSLPRVTLSGGEEDRLTDVTCTHPSPVMRGRWIPGSILACHVQPILVNATPRYSRYCG